jgi:hypothetical protein
MKDTNEKIEDLHYRLIMRRSAEERLNMCSSMFETAKEIIKTTLKDRTHWREELFLRIYGDDFHETIKEKILEAIRRYSESENFTAS